MIQKCSGGEKITKGKVEGAQKAEAITARLPTIECKEKGAQIKNDGDKHW